MYGWVVPCAADEMNNENIDAKFQATYVWQSHAPFHAAYSGANSLSAGYEKSYSFTSTAFIGYRPWVGGELYLNPEITQGVPLSNLAGLGGFNNGEIARSAGPHPSLYLSRFFLRQTWGVGGEQQTMESAPNQLKGTVEAQRWVATVGKLSVTDIFDNNAYNHDPRTQFLNWSLMNYGAYDFAADARGYSWGAALERYHNDWVVRAGTFIVPMMPNVQALDFQIHRHFGDQIELEHTYRFFDQSGKWRILAFTNEAKMSRFQDAINLANQNGGVPNVNNVRYGNQHKSGFGLSLEQALSQDVGVFFRGSWADGKTEAYAYTEIDRSLSFGALVTGDRWGRPADSMGLGLAMNGLSAVHQKYLANGGLGFFLGDGRLRYGQEKIIEFFYNVNLAKNSTVTLDWQNMKNPGYNLDRGPVNVIGFRLHQTF